MSQNIYEELYHHGILGMKWGKRNGPPYPLSSSAHSASERKAGWRKSLDGGSSRSDGKTGSRSRFSSSLAGGPAPTGKSAKKAKKGPNIVQRALRRRGLEMEYEDSVKRGKMASAASAKGLRQTLSSFYGHRGAAVERRAASKYYDKVAQMSTTKMGKSINKSRSKNAEAMSKYHEKASKRNFKERAKNFIVDKDLMKTPYYRINGKKTTVGRKTVERIIARTATAVAFDMVSRKYSNR